MKNLLDWFKKEETLKYYVLNVEDRNKALNVPPGKYSGGFQVTIKIIKTFKQFGKETKVERIEKFDNWHRARGGWTFWNGDWGNDGWNMLLNDDCETYKFAPINSQWLRDIVDKYAAKFGYPELLGEWA